MSWVAAGSHSLEISPSQVIWLELDGKPKIADLKHAVFRNQDVVHLHVEMNNAVLGKELFSLSQLKTPTEEQLQLCNNNKKTQDTIFDLEAIAINLCDVQRKKSHVIDLHQFSIMIHYCL